MSSDWTPTWPPWEATYDGSIRCREDQYGLGAAAVLWTSERAAGRCPLAMLTVALPGRHPPGRAEAWGASLSLLLLEALAPDDRRAVISGDCPPVVRFGAASGHLWDVASVQILSPAIARAAAAGWTCRWRLVRRHLNAAADSLARDAASRAAGLPPLAATPVFALRWDATRAPGPFAIRAHELLASLGPVSVSPL